MTEFYLPSHGKGRIHCVQWAPQGRPRAVVQIVHGIAEYVARYDSFARFLNQQGYLVVGEDHMGHGGSLIPGDPPGYFHGGWNAAVDDTFSLLQKTRQEHPQLPYVILGHSMGSFLTRTLLYRHPDSGIRAAVICGTAWQPEAALRAGLAMCRHAGLDRDMLTGIQMNQKKENLARMDKKLPVLFVAGTQDPVGNYGKGVRKSAEAFRKSGMEDVTVILYDKSRHEIFNDVEKEQVFQDVAQWISSKIL